MFKITLLSTLLVVLASSACAETKLVPIAKAWSKNSVNAVVFRRNSVVSHENSQYAAFFDADANVVLAKRALGNRQWQTHTTQYSGNVRDAHNSISIMVDGAGYLHMSWDHHGHPLRYCRSMSPGTLELTDRMPMTDQLENKVTYPEFYRLANGNLLFLYRDGASGNGNLVMNHYDTQSQQWTQRHACLIDGEGKQNAYWQMCTDQRGGIHLSWCWRATGNVATNHDVGYATSTDEGVTWRQSTGDAQSIPITVANAEYAAKIPQKHELINTTSMCADVAGRPYITTYWRPEGATVPQYHLIRRDTAGWRATAISERKTPFTLSGAGTKRIPISRPQIVADGSGEATKAYVVFRDTERQSRVSVAICDDLSRDQWRVEDLTDFSVGLWEPSYDTELWKRDKQLHLFVQPVEQGDGDTTVDQPPTAAMVIEWTPE